MREKQKEFLRFLKLLSDHGCLGDIILTGSWAEFLYMECQVIPGYQTNVRTLDIDFIVKNLRKPADPINVSTIAREEGFIVDKDRMTGITKIFDTTGLEVEFLIAKKGKGLETALETNLGITAQALRHLEILKSNTVKVQYFGIEVEVPLPEAFVLQKMVINSQRKGKAEKDRKAINAMYPHLDPEKWHRIKDRLTKKEKTEVDLYMSEFIEPEIDKTWRIEEAKRNLE